MLSRKSKNVVEKNVVEKLVGECGVKKSIKYNVQKRDSPAEIVGDLRRIERCDLPAMCCDITLHSGNT